MGTDVFLALPDGDRRAFFELSFDPELEIVQSAELVFDTDGTFHGYNGFIKAGRELVEGLGAIDFEPGKGFEIGNAVVFEVRARATGSGSGVPVELTMAHLWELRQGLACRWVVYPTVREALGAAGMQE
ncbi:MAG: nuclear transport factor 2 family protein [Solirubrobacterales bacterium]